MATANCGEPLIPNDARVLNGLASVSTMEMLLPAELEVKIAPVCGLMASDVGLMPTLTLEDPPVSGLNAEMILLPLEVI